MTKRYSRSNRSVQACHKACVYMYIHINLKLKILGNKPQL